MTYSEFLARMEAETLDQDSFSFEVESDFWEWERVETLLLTTAVAGIGTRPVIRALMWPLIP